MVHKSSYIQTSLLTISHLLVDGICACNMIMMADKLGAETTVVMFLLYNVVAFGSQPLTGYLIDCSKTVINTFVISFLLLVAGSVVGLAFVHYDIYWFAVFCTILLGIGNSLFHVYGGKYISILWQGDIRPIGVFVSTGTLGLTLGACFSSTILLTAFLFALVIVTVIHVRLESIVTKCIVKIRPDSKFVTIGALLMLFCLMFIVSGRSFISTVTPSLGISSSGLLILLSVVTMMGKASGGFFSVYFGVRTTLIVSLMLACGCFMLCESHIAFIPATIFLVNLSMPCTLYFANKVIPGREGTAFGLLAAVLLPGYILGEICMEYPSCHLFLTLLLSTIIIEGMLLIYMHERRWYVLTTLVIINVLTNVPLNIINYTSNLSLLSLLGLECLVILVEFVVYWGILRDKRMAFIYSSLCNTVSFIVGVFFQLIAFCFI